VQLVAANALLARRDQEDRLQPDIHRDVTRFEDRSNLHRERLAAVVALVRTNPGGLAGHLPVALDATTVRADRAARPDAGFHEGIRSLFVVEVGRRENGVSHERLLDGKP
jgi:hypothetical protein